MKTLRRMLVVSLLATISCATAWERYSTYYAEETHDGRTYVVGRPATHETFKKTHELGKSNTFVSAGSRGETVIIEGDDKDPALEARLIKQYRKRYGIDLR